MAGRNETENASAPRPPIATESIPWKEWSHGERFGGLIRRLGEAGGSVRIGVNLEELPAGKQSCPLHYHYDEEEHLLVLAGEATLRLGDCSYPVKTGDYVCFPAGQKAGHCLVNDGTTPCRFLMIGERSDRDVVVYPDSGKILVGAAETLFDLAAVREYWDGE